MPDTCRICEQDFKMEPGFYSGALWASYPIVVLLMICVGLVSYTALNLSLTTTFSVAAITTLILQPVIMRYGRAIWINLFIRYNGKR